MVGTQAGVQEQVPEGGLRTHRKGWRRVMSSPELGMKDGLVAGVENGLVAPWNPGQRVNAATLPRPSSPTLQGQETKGCTGNPAGRTPGSRWDSGSLSGEWLPADNLGQ